MFLTVLVASRAGLMLGARYTLPSQSCCFMCNYTQSWEEAPGVFAERCSVQRRYNLKRTLCEGPEEFFDCSLSQLQAAPGAGAGHTGKKGSCSPVSLTGGLAHVGN